MRAAALSSLLAAGAAGLKVGMAQVDCVKGATPQAEVSQNLDKYAALMQQASEQAVRVVVFPEFGPYGGTCPISCKDTAHASGLAPYCDAVPAAGSVPCGGGGGSQAERLSCMAKNSSTFLSANVCEVDAEGRLWNSQLIFDDSGRLLANYHKTHPYSKCFSAPEPGHQQNVTVKVDDVTFGVFTCKDILYHTPGVTLREMGYDKFLYCASIPVVGDLTIGGWSLLHKATMVYSDRTGGLSGVFAHGKRLTAKPPKHGDFLVTHVL
eukprot:TRINITY_DN40088_c0_g1_i1.p1 TRINITY_DN40088_c0_g1~~TRINITY_DN40088_c0_g1_i1.p1  ORF type:complete len:266 (+),score=95.29 TRINITY_DN40088_c0_g1_i1:56-853(+)